MQRALRGSVGPAPVQPWDCLLGVQGWASSAVTGAGGHKLTLYLSLFVLSHASAMLKSRQFAVLCLSSATETGRPTQLV